MQDLINLVEEPRDEIQRTLSEWWANALALTDVSVDADWFFMGGNALMGSLLIEKIRQKYDVDLGPTALYDAGTISKLADLIQLKRVWTGVSSIVPIQTNGSRLPLFMIHPVGGNILGFHGLVKRLRPDQPVYGVQAQALQPNVPALTRLEEMASYYIDEIRRVQPQGPYYLLGYSFGGLVAYEIAQQLQAKGEIVGMLGMVDTWQVSFLRKLPKPSSVWKQIYMRVRLAYLRAGKSSPRMKLAYLLKKLKGRGLRAFSRASAAPPNTLSVTLESARAINMNAALRYEVQPYDGKIVLFRATDEEDWLLPEDLGWRAMALRGLDLHKIPGDHGSMFAEPQLSQLAHELTQCLARSVSEKETSVIS
jgi:thioesterase domain-containing protein